MKSVKELRKKVATRTRKKTPVYSTSEARANFAEALETAQVESAVIGFDRYGRTVAALVPVEAVYMLAGMEHLVSPAQREQVIAGARAFVADVPTRLTARTEDAPPKPARAKAAPKKAAPKKAAPKAPAKKKKKPAKAAAAKRPAKTKRDGGR
ncbi:MAG TPA: hypothetical protein VM915_08695 [Verrucomicrobiae bacterium]|nr:hypothetical protein [Verrucomicrobiae bacterium]